MTFYADNIKRMEREIEEVEDAMGSPDALWVELDEKRQALVAKLERLKKRQAIEERLDDEYQITVQFTRSLAEDIGYALDSGMEFDVGLVHQFVRELQDSIEQSGEPAGHFSVEAITFWTADGHYDYRFAVSTGKNGIELTGVNE